MVESFQYSELDFYNIEILGICPTSSLKCEAWQLIAFQKQYEMHQTISNCMVSNENIYAPKLHDINTKILWCEVNALHF